MAPIFVCYPLFLLLQWPGILPSHKPIMTGAGDLGGRRSFAANPTPGANCAAAALAEAAEGQDGERDRSWGRTELGIFLAGACPFEKKGD